jgi:hypothetical protein
VQAKIVDKHVHTRSHDERLLSSNCQPSSFDVLEAKEPLVNTKKGRKINIMSAIRG